MTVLPNFHVNTSGHKRGTPKQPKGKPGQLDTVTTLQDGQFAEIQIQLTQSLDWGSNPFQLKSGSPLIFCNLKVVGQLMTFDTYRVAGGPTYSTYALQLVVHDPSNAGEDLNVIIDPIIDNDGIDRRIR